MSFADLLKLKDELGSKVYNEALFGENAKATRKKKRKPVNTFKRENKNRPREVSAKKQVPLLGKVVKTKKNEGPRDPRFDSKCGEFDREQFKANYSFVNEIREKEIFELKKQLREMRSDQAEEKQKIKLVLQRMLNQNLEAKKLKERKERKLSLHQKNKEAIKKDKKTFFVSKGKFSANDFTFTHIKWNPKSSAIFFHLFIGEQKAQDLVKQFEELKKSGGLNKHLEKRRKKNISRDRKKYDF